MEPTPPLSAEELQGLVDFLKDTDENTMVELKTMTVLRLISTIRSMERRVNASDSHRTRSEDYRQLILDIARNNY